MTANTTTSANTASASASANTTSPATPAARLHALQIGVEAAARLARLATESLEGIEYAEPTENARAMAHTLNITLEHLSNELYELALALEDRAETGRIAP